MREVRSQDRKDGSLSKRRLLELLRCEIRKRVSERVEDCEVKVMKKIPQGIEKFKGSWGTSYYYKGIHIAKGSGRYSTPYDFRVGQQRVLASTLVEAVREIEKIIQKQE